MSTSAGSNSRVFDALLCDDTVDVDLDVRPPVETGDPKRLRTDDPSFSSRSADVSMVPILTTPAVLPIQTSGVASGVQENLVQEVASAVRAATAAAQGVEFLLQQFMSGAFRGGGTATPTGGASQHFAGGTTTPLLASSPPVVPVVPVGSADANNSVNGVGIQSSSPPCAAAVGAKNVEDSVDDDQKKHIHKCVRDWSDKGEKWLNVKRLIEKTKKEVEELSTDSQRYPAGVRPHKPPVEAKELDDVWSGCIGVAHESKICFPANTSRRNAIIGIHRSATLAIKKIYLEGALAREVELSKLVSRSAFFTAANTWASPVVVDNEFGLEGAPPPQHNVVAGQTFATEQYDKAVQKLRDGESKRREKAEKDKLEEEKQEKDVVEGKPEAMFEDVVAVIADRRIAAATGVPVAGADSSQEVVDASEKVVSLVQHLRKSDEGGGQGSGKGT